VKSNIIVLENLEMTYAIRSEIVKIHMYM